MGPRFTSTFPITSSSGRKCRRAPPVDVDRSASRILSASRTLVEMVCYVDAGSLERATAEPVARPAPEIPGTDGAQYRLRPLPVHETPEPHAMTEQDLEAIRTAVQLLENASPAAPPSAIGGKPIQLLGSPPSAGGPQGTPPPPPPGPPAAPHGAPRAPAGPP